MQLTPIQIFIIILAVAFGTILTRFLPFVLFPEKREAPKIVTYLSRVLPAAMMGLLVVYCLKNVTMTSMPYGLPEIIAIAVIIILHKWKNNVLLSIVGGTVVYMVLVQAVFI
jgi:branched-subunit amino acid transport protein AzlD